MKLSKLVENTLCIIFSVTHYSDLLYDALLLQEAFRHLDLTGLPKDISILQEDIFITDSIRVIETELAQKYEDTLTEHGLIDHALFEFGFSRHELIEIALTERALTELQG